jgi:hypothetical protein
MLNLVTPSRLARVRHCPATSAVAGGCSDRYNIRTLKAGVAAKDWCFGKKMRPGVE